LKVETSGLGTAGIAPARPAIASLDVDALRLIAVVAGLGAALLFPIVGLRYQFQTYGDGSLFSYAVAAQEVWTFHWHNISGRTAVYLLTMLPAEGLVALTGSPAAGIYLYGALFYGAQLAGLAATYAADRSRGQVIFTFACCSTVCLCPLVFGFPTEMWITHALFWPTLAVCLYARLTPGNSFLILLLQLALSFTHGAALIFQFVILAILSLRGLRDAVFSRALSTFLVVLPVWIVVKLVLRPDAYVGPVMVNAAFHVFDLSILTGDMMRLLYCAVAGYGIVFCALRAANVGRPEIHAFVALAAALSVYWLKFDHALHAENRYYLRTILIIATPGFAALAGAYALAGDGGPDARIPPLLERLLNALPRKAPVPALAGALLIVALVHTVETAKFASVWTQYTAAVRALAMGSASDPKLGDPNFVSSTRIGAPLDAMSWQTTTPFLSVLVSPGFAPKRLVVNPYASFFWQSCGTATQSLRDSIHIPAESRLMLQRYACLHRKSP
jgi:hypothetical protein